MREKGQEPLKVHKDEQLENLSHEMLGCSAFTPYFNQLNDLFHTFASMLPDTLSN